MKLRDLTNQTLCICQCGNNKIISGGLLKSGNTKSCGCLKHKEKRIDLIGQKFGMLTVIKFNHKSKEGAACWLCKCNCGKEKITSTYNLRSGHITTCGCLYKKDTIKQKTV